MRVEVFECFRVSFPIVPMPVKHIRVDEVRKDKIPRPFIHPIAINCATFTGYMQAGFAGAVSATLGMIMPSFLIIYLISMFFDNFLEITVIASAFKGIKIAVGILIFQAALTMIKKMKKKLRPRVFMLTAFAAMMIINITAVRFSTIWLLVIAAVTNVIIYKVSEFKETKGEAK